MITYRQSQQWLMSEYQYYNNNYPTVSLEAQIQDRQKTFQEHVMIHWIIVNVYETTEIQTNEKYLCPNSPSGASALVCWP